MKSHKLLLTILSLLLAIVPISCNNNDDETDENANCEDTICTAVFIRILVSITDGDQNPVALDSYQVINTENGNDMTIPLTPSEFSSAQEFGQYPLVQDGTLDLNQSRQIQFRGFINNQEVISSNYTISTDCCHVELVSGELQLTL